MEINIIASWVPWVQIIVSVVFFIMSIYLICFWCNEKDKLRFFISLKDILDQIGSDSVSSINKESYKKVIIENSALGTNRKSDDVVKTLSTLNDPVELEARKLLVSPNFLIILITIIIVSLLYLFQASLDLGYIPQGILSNEFAKFVRESILNQMSKVFGILLTFLFMAYLWPLIKRFWAINLWPLIKRFWAIIKGKFKNN